jgi:polysaccharide pyruvyl transferase WcaK-like protein
MDSDKILDILFYGWYNKQNVGDDLFEFTFKRLFNNLNIKFTSKSKDIADLKYKYLILGGGNIIHPVLIDNIKNTKVPYEFWSVSVLDDEQAQIALGAKRIITRDVESADFMKKASYKGELIVAPDIVFYNHDIIVPKPKIETIAFLPNSNFVPNYLNTISKCQEYQRFIYETARHIDDGGKYEFIAMQNSPWIDDNIVSYTILGATTQKRMSLNKNANWLDLSTVYNYKAVITMRYHGMIIGILNELPVISIDGHSKIKNFCKHYNLSSINYYEYSKDCIGRALAKTLKNEGHSLEIKKQIISQVGIFDELSKELVGQVQ